MVKELIASQGDPYGKVCKAEYTVNDKKKWKICLSSLSEILMKLEEENEIK